jgi:YjbE family integral membrane protein
MTEALSTSAIWVALTQIIVINILLSGDNAVVIALASRKLPPRQQKAAIVFGSVGAIGLRIALTFFAMMLLAVPYLKLVGAVLLLWIGAKMLVDDDDGSELRAQDHLWAAIRTIIVADFVMSLDNVIGVAAAAKGNIPLLVVGLVISIPLIVYGSTLVLKLMRRFPIVVTLGAALLGWVAGEMAVEDHSIADWVHANADYLETLVPVVCASLVVVTGKWMARRVPAHAIAPPVELPPTTTPATEQRREAT